MMEQSDRRVDVILIGGRLGTGKTSVIRRLLSHFDPASTGLLVNEAAAGGIDQFTLKVPGFRIEDLFGCICCRPAEDTVSALLRLKESARPRQLERIVIETSGLASMDLLVADLLADYRFLRNFDIAVVATVVDGSSLDEQGTIPADPRSIQTDVILVSHLDTLPAHMVPQCFAQIETYYNGGGSSCIIVPSSDLRVLIDGSARIGSRSPAERLRQVTHGATSQQAGTGHGLQANYFEHRVSLNTVHCLELGQALSLFGRKLRRFKMLCSDRAGPGTLLLNVTNGKMQTLERLEPSLEGTARIFYVADVSIVENLEKFVLSQINPER